MHIADVNRLTHSGLLAMLLLPAAALRAIDIKALRVFRALKIIHATI
jgi:hypothetical protein